MISKSGNADGKVPTQDPLAWRRQFAGNNKTVKWRKDRRRDGKQDQRMDRYWNLRIF